MKTILLIATAAVTLLVSSCADQNSTATNTTASTNPARRDYSRNDLERTGRQTTAGAIQAADPSVTISNGGGGGAHP